MQQSIEQFSYYDGSGNAYMIHEGHFKYEPVTPESSSSGIYSGGEAVARKISEVELSTAKRLFEGAVSAVDQHQDDRAMMTGLVVLARGSDTTRVVLKPGSSKKAELENFLMKLKGN